MSPETAQFILLPAALVATLTLLAAGIGWYWYRQKRVLAAIETIVLKRDAHLERGAPPRQWTITAPAGRVGWRLDYDEPPSATADATLSTARLRFEVPLNTNYPLVLTPRVDTLPDNVTLAGPSLLDLDASTRSLPAVAVDGPLAGLHEARCATPERARHALTGPQGQRLRRLSDHFQGRISLVWRQNKLQVSAHVKLRDAADVEALLSAGLTLFDLVGPNAPTLTDEDV